MDIVGQTKKHWFVGLIIIASICVSTTWFVANAVLVQPRDFAITQLEKTIDDLENRKKRFRRRK